MAAIRSKDMKPEMLVRRMLHRLGYRYRLHRKDLPGKPDVVFGPRRKVIFVHGCFWHQHADTNCLDGRLPRTRQEYWVPKLERNVARDRRNISALENAGWRVCVVWECEMKDLTTLEKKLRDFLDRY